MAAAFIAIAAVLLLGAGIGKVLAPDPASDALGALGLPSHPSLVRIGALVECLLAATALLVSSMAVQVLLGCSYLAFAVFVALLRRQPSAMSCGCFGGEGELPSLRHVVVNLALAAGCLLAAATGSSSLVALLRADSVTGLATALLSACGAWIVVLLLRGGTEAMST